MIRHDVYDTLKITGLTKHFPGIVALNFNNNESITFYSGEIHGLVGENGAGKSTLVSLIAGIQKPTKGTMFFNQEIYSPENVPDARQHGVEIILQDSGLVRKMTVADNLFLGRERIYTEFGLINPRKKKKLAEETIQRVSENIPVDISVSELDLENQKLVELARVLLFNPKIIIVDEITAGLSDKTANLVFKILRRLRDEGKIIIYISHYLDEVFDLCDQVTVLKDGCLVKTKPVKETNEDDLSTLMVGRPTRSTMYHLDKISEKKEKVIFSVKDLSLENVFEKISFDLHKGEILGIGGLLGCGNEELALTLFGGLVSKEGQIFLGENKIKNSSPRSAISKKIAYLPKDRDREGLILRASLLNNVFLPSLPWFSRIGFIFNINQQKIITEKLIQSLKISCRGVKDVPMNLSGGNRQKIALSKWLVRDNKILILNNPTRGVDVGSKYEIYSMIRDLSKKGIGIILISQELPELIGMCDKIFIMRNGRITKSITKKEYPTEEMLISYMLK